MEIASLWLIVMRISSVVYVNYVDRTSPNHLTSWGRGDWVPVKSRSNKEFTSSVYFYVDTKILATAAKLFNKQDDYTYYTALAEKIKEAVNNKYLNKEYMPVVPRRN